MMMAVDYFKLNLVALPSAAVPDLVSLFDQNNTSLATKYAALDPKQRFFYIYP